MYAKREILISDEGMKIPTLTELRVSKLDTSDHTHMDS